MGASQAQRRRIGIYEAQGRKGGGFSLEISAVGLRRLRKTLATLEPIAAKEFTKQLKAPLQQVQRDAKGYVQSRTGAMKRGIKFGAYKRSGRHSLGGYKVWQSTAQGNILEFAGSTNPTGKSGSRSGAKLISTLNERYGNTGRFIWRSYDHNHKEVERAMREVIREAERRVEREAAKLGAGFGYTSNRSRHGR